MALGYLFGAEDPDGTHGTGGASGDSADPAAGLAIPVVAEAVEPFLARLDPREVTVVRRQVARRLNAPQASSAGRLFDAAASLLGIRDIAEYEAQAAIDLELAAGERTAAPLPYRITRVDGLLVYDPRPTLAALIAARAGGTAAAPLAAAFQETIALVTRELLAEVQAATGVRTVCLSGGVFQNRRLASVLLRRLARDGFEVFINRRVPVNDGG
jgi:hydrogenase maturation protein HypF